MLSAVRREEEEDRRREEMEGLREGSTEEVKMGVEGTGGLGRVVRKLWRGLGGRGW